MDEASSDTTSLTIQGQAIDNAPTFTSASGNISNRTKTTASVPWSPAVWTTVGEAGPNQQTPNISAVVQEIVNRAGWFIGNSLAVIITGTWKRVAESFNGVADACRCWSWNTCCWPRISLLCWLRSATNSSMKTTRSLSTASATDPDLPANILSFSLYAKAGRGHDQSNFRSVQLDAW